MATRFLLPVLLLTFTLAACGREEPPTPTRVLDARSPLYGGDPNEPPPPPSGQGGFCGGIIGKACAEGLVCEYDGDYPDSGGTCVPE